MKRVLISGYCGFGNAGDEAILECILDQLQAAAAELGEDWQFVALSADPKATSRQYGIEAIGRTSFFSIWKTLCQSHFLLSGGGGLLQDVTGRFSAIYYLGICLQAALLGKPFLIYAHGIGPLRGKLNRLFTRFIFNRATYISVRDDGSRRLLREIGVKKEVALTADPAFCLKPIYSERVDGYLKLLSGEGRFIAISLRTWPGLRLEEIASALDSFCRGKKTTALLLPLYLKMDLPLCRELAKILTSPVLLVEETLKPGEIMALMSRGELTVGMRLHALIFSALGGTVPIAISYDPKVDALMERLSLPVAGRAWDISRERLLASLDRAWEEQGEISRGLNPRVENLKKQAAESAREVALLLAERKKRG